MDIIFILIPFSLMLVGFFIAAFIWATKSGQHDDLETPAHRMLLDDEEIGSMSKKDGHRPVKS